MRKLAVVLIGLSLVGAQAWAAGSQCMYADQLFSPGAVACQGGVQFRCGKGGSWENTGLGCSDLRPQQDQPAILDDPSRQAPGVREPGVRQPASPSVPPAPSE